MRWLDYHDLWYYVPEDANASKLRLSGYRDRKTHVQILPSDVLAKWHLFRSKLYSQYLSRGMFKDEMHGAYVQSKGLPAWAWWIHDYQKLRLCIGRMSVARKTGFVAAVRPLLEAAVIEAAHCGLREVVIWDPSEQVRDAADELILSLEAPLEASQEDRLEMVPCLRWKGGEEREIVWEEGELYTWS